MVEMTDEEYNAYETRQKAFQESEQGQKELKEHAEWKRKREAEEEEESRSNTIKEPIEGGKNDPIENTNSSLGMEPIREVAETAVEEHANLKQTKKMGKARAMFQQAEQERYDEKLKYAKERQLARDGGVDRATPSKLISDTVSDRRVARKDTIDFNKGLKQKRDEEGYEQQYKSNVTANEEARQMHTPVKSSSFEQTVAKAKKFGTQGTTHYQDTATRTSQVPVHTPPLQPFGGGDPFAAMNADTAMGYGKPVPDKNGGRTYTPYEGTYRKESINAEVFDMMNADTAQHNTSDIDFGGVNAGGSKADELAAKQKKIADYQKAQPSMEKEAEAATQKKWKEDRDKKTLEEYKANRSSVGKVMDLFSREHAQEIGYAAEKKVEAHLKERRIENEIKARKKIEPLLIQNDQNLKEGKINEAMHADREKKYLGKMEQMSVPIEQKVGGAVKREANSAFGILNEVMTSPEKRKELQRAGVHSEFENNTISATFARGVASTTKQLQEKPAKSQPMIFTRGSVAPAFVGAETHRLPTTSSFYGVMPSARAPRGTKGKASPSAKKGGSQINFGASAPISFGGAGFGLFGRGQQAPTPPPPAPKPHARKKR